MRLMVDRWYVGPVCAVAALYVCLIVGSERASTRIFQISDRTIDRIYTLASRGQFDEIWKEHLTSETSVKYLRMQDQCFGRVKQWTIDHPYSGGEAAWSAIVQVQREKASLNERVDGSDPHVALIALSPGENDQGMAIVGDPKAVDSIRPSPDFTVGELEPGPRVSSAAEAINAVRPMIHSVDAAYSPSALTVHETADFWVISEKATRGKGPESRFFVLSKSGEHVEHVWATGSSLGYGY
ncbi:MAG TPA: hypothetical protein VHE55_03705 [Fimbriimonadaceae bacterium]|nr:hypothetical protein [Fimbriimonadaceae bacterium]